MNAALKAVPRPDELVTGYLRALLAEKQADWPINPGEYENDLLLFKQGLDGIPTQQRTRDIIFAMPMLFLGGLQLLYAITGFYPTRSPFAFWLRRTAERNQLGYSMKQPGGR